MTAAPQSCQPKISELLVELRRHEADYPELIHGPLCGQAADRIETLEMRVVALEQVISEEMYPENCDDDANRMLLESAIESHKRRINARAALPKQEPKI